MATSMRPSDDDLKRIELAKRAIEKAVEVAFPGSRAEYFGSAVNGFETNLSDIDCVVLLSPSAAKKLLEDGEEQLEEDHPGASAPATATRASTILVTVVTVVAMRCGRARRWGCFPGPSGRRARPQLARAHASRAAGLPSARPSSTGRMEGLAP